jgi:hypothetical protein
MITRAHRSRAVAAITAVFLLTAGAACADEIKVMTSGAFTAAYLKLARSSNAQRAIISLPKQRR